MECIPPITSSGWRVFFVTAPGTRSPPFVHTRISSRLPLIAPGKCPYSGCNGAIRSLMTLVERGVDHIDIALKRLVDSLRVGR